MNVFLEALLGKHCSEALESVVRKHSQLGAVLLPRAILSWIGAVGERYEGLVPGTKNMIKFERTNGLYTGSATLNGKVLEYSQKSAMEIGAYVSISLGAEIPDVMAKSEDIVKLGKSLDQMIGTVIKNENRAAVRSVMQKSPLHKLQIGKAEPKGTTAKPTNANPPANATNAMAPVAPKSVATQTPKKGAIPGKTVKVTKSQSMQECKLCKTTRFKAGKFVGCFCYSELAKHATTTPTTDGFILTAPKDTEALMMLALELR